MKNQSEKHPYGCSAYEIGADFDFDLTLNFGDYVYLAFYLVAILPFVAAGKIIMQISGLLTRFPLNRQEDKQSSFSSNKLHTVFSKFF